MSRADASKAGSHAHRARVVALLVTASLLLVTCAGGLDEISSVASVPPVETETPEVAGEPPAPAPSSPEAAPDPPPPQSDRSVALPSPEATEPDGPTDSSLAVPPGPPAEEQVAAPEASEPSDAEPSDAVLDPESPGSSEDEESAAAPGSTEPPGVSDSPEPRAPVESAPPPLELPPPLPTTPAWSPVTILVAKENVNGVVPVYDGPGGNRLSFRDGDVWSYTFRGNRLVVRVLRGSQGDEWAQVELPVRPNGSRGWVRTENFNWSTVRHHIRIDVSDRSVTLYEGDNLVATTSAIVGKSTTPTPILRGFIVEKLPNRDRSMGNVVGDWILMLSFFSEALDTFGGGLPRIALHGTHIPERVGEALSNGCIRIPNNIIEVIARTAPLGTVVNITA